MTCLRICVVTGTRADYGLLRPVVRALDAAEDFEFLAVATGVHPWSRPPVVNQPLQPAAIHRL